MINDKNIKPFLRWAGGKTWLTKEIDNYLPDSFNNYFEPFIGGGSIYINLKSRNIIQNYSYLSDINKDLINAYRIIKKYPKELVEDLEKHRNESDYYYKMRSAIFANPIEQASRFIYLNRTSFNGIYRENMNGIYNVPYGNKHYAELFDTENILELSSLFKKSYFSIGDFKQKLNKIQPRDLVFIDPPYTVAHGNNGFIKYNQKIFSWKDQIRLNEFIGFIKEKGAYFIMTNAYHESILELFSDHGDISVLSRYSVVGGKMAKREKYKEIILSNIN